MPQELPQRLCQLCGQIDDHPRHIHATGTGDMIRHLDCCAAYGCPDGSCDKLMPGADGKTGDALRSYLTSDTAAAAVASTEN